jgi:hypothetical protein
MPLTIEILRMASRKKEKRDSTLKECVDVIEFANKNPKLCS